MDTITTIKFENSSYACVYYSFSMASRKINLVPKNNIEVKLLDYRKSGSVNSNLSLRFWQIKN